MVKLENITSIYEVAFATNFILGYLIATYRDVYLESVKIILTQSKGKGLAEDDNFFILQDGNKFSKKAFSKIKYLFVITVIFSIIAIVFSFLFLLFAGIIPEYTIPTWLFVISSSLFILVNPIGYFIYKIYVLNFKHTINGEKINDSEISNFIKSYVPFPIYRESVLQKIKLFFYFKIKYIKNLFRKNRRA
ncbi:MULTISPECIES: hypothetical protein [unclassified Sulfurospirillum]|uniref:hypothetical protein n=1 Tax=unclassified Sulfurospirillum TaxID=2618290 RepID=UPI00050311E4|nr:MULTISPECIES: hypothetical protein [unclassified Sulfurospirillum]KFL34097.1 hypothetical protein JU57_07225 [Sulfurospirillum sp. SCADC]